MYKLKQRTKKYGVEKGMGGGKEIFYHSRKLAALGWKTHLLVLLFICKKNLICTSEKKNTYSNLDRWNLKSLAHWKVGWKVKRHTLLMISCIRHLIWIPGVTSQRYMHLNELVVPTSHRSDMDGPVTYRQILTSIS